MLHHAESAKGLYVSKCDLHKCDATVPFRNQALRKNGSDSSKVLLGEKGWTEQTLLHKRVNICVSNLTDEEIEIEICIALSVKAGHVREDHSFTATESMEVCDKSQ